MNSLACNWPQAPAPAASGEKSAKFTLLEKLRIHLQRHSDSRKWIKSNFSVWPLDPNSFILWFKFQEETRFTRFRCHKCKNSYYTTTNYILFDLNWMYRYLQFPLPCLHNEGKFIVSSLCVNIHISWTLQTSPSIHHKEMYKEHLRIFTPGLFLWILYWWVTHHSAIIMCLHSNWGLLGRANTN